MWYGNTDAVNYTTKCRNFVASVGGIDQIKAGYTQSGTVIGNYQDPTFTGSFASAILTSTNQNEVNTAYATLKKQTSTAYFAATLRVLYMYTMTGNLYNPLTDNTTVDDTLTATNPSQFIAAGASQAITITSNVNWTVSENSSWLSINTTSGNNNGNVVVTVAANSSTSNRTATITISGGTITRNISISQAGANEPNTSFIPDPNKEYYIGNSYHNIRLGADGSDNPLLTNTSVTSDNVKWKITASPTNDYYYIDNIDGGDRPCLRGNNTAFADMNATTSRGTWTRWKFTPSTIEGSYLLTTLGNTLPRLQINNNNKTAMVTTASAGAWESFTITEVNPSNSTVIFIEAEDFTDMKDIQTEPTENEGAGEINVGYIDTGDWMEYSVTINSAGNYYIDYRLASLPGNAVLQFQVNGNTLATTNINATGGWQSWTTYNLADPVYLNAGIQTIRLYSTGDNFNINWFTLEAQNTSAKTTTEKISDTIHIFPVSVTNNLNLSIANYQDVSKLEIMNITGALFLKDIKVNTTITPINISNLSNGVYFLRVYKKGLLSEVIKFVK